MQALFPFKSHTQTMLMRISHHNPGSKSGQIPQGTGDGPAPPSATSAPPPSAQGSGQASKGPILHQPLASPGGHMGYVGLLTACSGCPKRHHSPNILVPSGLQNPPTFHLLQTFLNCCNASLTWKLSWSRVCHSFQVCLNHQWVAYSQAHAVTGYH